VPTKAELRETAAALRRLLDSHERGELSASAGALARLEGARVALEALGAGKARSRRTRERREDFGTLAAAVLTLDDDDFEVLVDLIAEEADRRWPPPPSA
jgi:hypothetical protein